MATLNAPPQAYTREVLTQAFEWLHQQPASVREVAHSIDAMVALYLQAKRRGQMNLGPDAVSTQTFKNDLKNLAEGLRQFEAPEPESRVVPPSPAPATATTTEPALDQQSLESLQLVRKSLNLSSNTEALRMLVALGFERVKDLLPKT